VLPDKIEYHNELRDSCYYRIFVPTCQGKIPQHPGAGIKISAPEDKVALYWFLQERKVCHMEIVFNWVVPVLRIFDIAKADEFYQGFLGFSVDWDHRFDPNTHSTDRFRAAV
jgi:hypothetical protein